MADTKRVVILGGHSRVGRLAAPELIEAGWTTGHVIQRPTQTSEIQRLGGVSFLLDLATATVSDIAAVLDGAEAVVFTARADAGDDAAIDAVDRRAAERSIAAAEQAGVKRYVMVSSAAAAQAESLTEGDDLFAYGRAKAAADERLRASGLDYTILRPGPLTDEPAGGKITVGAEGSPLSSLAETSRGNVAAAIVHAILADAAVGETVTFTDGDAPVAEALA